MLGPTKHTAFGCKIGPKPLQGRSSGFQNEKVYDFLDCIFLSNLFTYLWWQSSKNFFYFNNFRKIFLWSNRKLILVIKSVHRSTEQKRCRVRENDRQFGSPIIHMDSKNLPIFGVCKIFGHLSPCRNVFSKV